MNTYGTSGERENRRGDARNKISANAHTNIGNGKPKSSLMITFSEKEQPPMTLSSLKKTIVPLIINGPPILRDKEDFRLLMGTECAQELRDACKTELERLKSLGIYELMEIPETTNSLQNHWVASPKSGTNNEGNEFDVRLVIDDYSHAKWYENSRMIKRVPRPEHVRAFLVAAVQHDWHLHQLDISATPLYAHTGVNVYTDQPVDFDDQTGRKLQLKHVFCLPEKDTVDYMIAFTKEVETIRFEPLKLYPCIFEMVQAKSKAFLIVNGGELLVGSEDAELLGNAIKALKQLFEANDIGEPELFASMHIERSEGQILLDSREEISDLLKHFKRELAEFKSRTDIHENFFYSQSNPYLELIPPESLYGEFNPLDNRSRFKYRQGTTALCLIANRTRPDILLSANGLTSSQGDPKGANGNMLIRIVYYLSLNPTAPLVIKKNTNPMISAYLDVSNTPSIQFLRLGLCLFLGTNPIFWDSRSLSRSIERACKGIKDDRAMRALRCIVPLLDKFGLTDEGEEGVLYTCSRTGDSTLSYDPKRDMRFDRMYHLRDAVNDIQTNQEIKHKMNSRETYVPFTRVKSTINSLLYLMCCGAKAIGHETIQRIQEE